MNTINDKNMNQLSLKTEFEKIMRLASANMSAFPWENREAYAGFLSQTYFFVRHSSRLLALGAASAKQGEDLLHKRMVAHLREEMGHDVVAANDLKNLGFDVALMRESSLTKAFYQNQYFTLQNNSAGSFLGWILFLEGVAAAEGPAIYRRVSETFGPKCTHFVKLHAEEDQDHIQKALSTVDGLNDQDQQEAISNMWQSADLYFLMLQEIQQSLGIDVEIRAKAGLRAPMGAVNPQTLPA